MILDSGRENVIEGVLTFFKPLEGEIEKRTIVIHLT